MKSLKIFLIAAVCMATATAGYSQKTKTESFRVSGECGQCKKKIEKSAREAGATHAVWDQHTKMLKVSYKPGTEISSIQQKIAEAGYDTPAFRAPDEAYNSLDKCCQYERQAEIKATSCCTDNDCQVKDSRCADMTMCKGKSCCKDEVKGPDRSCCEKTGVVEKKTASGQ